MHQEENQVAPAQRREEDRCFRITMTKMVGYCHAPGQSGWYVFLQEIKVIWKNKSLAVKILPHLHQAYCIPRDKNK